MRVDHSVVPVLADGLHYHAVPIVEVDGSVVLLVVVREYFGEPEAEAITRAERVAKALTDTRLSHKV